MSSYNNHGNYNRYDSALDLSQVKLPQFTADYDYEETQTIAASSLSRPTSPWSQLNLRQESTFTPFVTQDYSLATRIFDDDVHSLGVTSQTFNDPFTPYIPGPHYSTPDIESLIDSSAPPSPTLPQPWAAASSTAASSAFVTSTTSDGNTIPCGQCGKKFTGTYRRGNLTRHVRQKHMEAKGGPYTCTAKGCFRVFQRADARLKHTRSKHPELCSPAVPRRQGTEQTHTIKQDDSATPNPNLTYVGHWLQPGQGLVNTHVPTVRHLINPARGGVQLPVAALSIFRTLHHKLEPAAYALVCDSFFSRWESIVEQLHKEGSKAHPVYAEVLQDIHAVVRAIDSSTTLGGSRSHASGRPVPPRKGRSSLSSGGGITSPHDRVAKSSDRRQSNANGSRKNLIVPVGKRKVKNEGALVECPVYKYHRMHGTTPPCNGCREGVMAQVRGHLNPSRAGNHRGFPSFIANCSRCKLDFINRDDYEAHRRASNCELSPQIRGDILTSWVRLYLTLYPRDLRVPSPWVNDNTWLDESEVESCRGPFLGHRQRSNTPPIQRPQSTNSLPTQLYELALGHMLHDIVDPNVIHSSGHTEPILNPNRMSTIQLQGSLAQLPTRTPEQHWYDVLHSLQAHQRALRHAAAHLTSNQMRVMVQQCERQIDIYNGLYRYHQQQEHQLQAQTQLPSRLQSDLQLPPDNVTHTATHPTMNSFQDEVEAEAISPMTPVRPHVSPLSSYGQYLTPMSSTQPSSAGNRTGSSLNYTSSNTTLSSTMQAFDDSYYLSPGPSLNQRRASMSHGWVPDPTCPRFTLPSSLSLPDNNGNNGSPYMEPSAPATPNDENEDPFRYLNP